MNLLNSNDPSFIPNTNDGEAIRIWQGKLFGGDIKDTITLRCSTSVLSQQDNELRFDVKYQVRAP